MVHVVLAGGAGAVGREILEELVLQKKHRATVFSRQEIPNLTAEGIEVVKVDYLDKATLVNQLAGVHTVLSFITPHVDPENRAQKTLIDACIEAGVRRFAPSEWATTSECGIPAYTPKDEVHEYLKEINKAKKVLEYTLFQPGLFTNFISHPRPCAKHMETFPMPFDIEHRRALIVDENDHWVLTTVQDLAKVVAHAIDYEGEWSEKGGVRGERISIKQLLQIAEGIRGPFKVTKLAEADLAAGKINADWMPITTHHSIPPEMREEISMSYFAAFILSIHRGVWDVSDEWNQLLPDMKFERVEVFLRKAWGDS